MGGNIEEFLEAVALRGVNFRELSREIGLSQGSLSNAKKEEYPLGIWHLSPIKRAVRKRGLILSRCGDSGSEIRRAIERGKIRSTVLTEELGITRQCLWQTIDGAGRDEKRKEIADIIRRLGRELLEIAER